MDVSLFENKKEYQTLIKLLSKEPLDAISVSTYGFSDDAFGSGASMGALTREATVLPLLICGQIHDRPSAEAALKEADIVLSGKALLLNPNWVADIKTGKQLPRYNSEDANVAYTDEPLP